MKTFLHHIFATQYSWIQTENIQEQIGSYIFIGKQICHNFKYLQLQITGYWLVVWDYTKENEKKNNKSQTTMK